MPAEYREKAHDDALRSDAARARARSNRTIGRSAAGPGGGGTQKSSVARGVIRGAGDTSRSNTRIGRVTRS